MSWLKLAQPPVVKIISYTFGGGTITVLINSETYTYYYDNVGTIKNLERNIKNRWYGKALEILNNLELAG